MNKEKIKKLIEELNMLGIPESSSNQEIDDIWDSVILYHSDYIAWEYHILRDTLNKKTIKPEIYLDDYLNKRIRDFKPKTDEEKQCILNIKKFKDKMDEIVKELLKD